jgi:CRP-like cAMP-binding protein
MVEQKESDQVCGRQFSVDLPRGAFRRRRQSAPFPDQRPDTDELVRRLRRFGMFEAMPAEALAELAPAASVQVFHSGETIWREGEANRCVLFIERGLVKSARRNRSGVNRTYGLHGPGDSMGIYAIWAGMKYPTDAVALNDGMTALLIDSAALVRFAQRHPGLADPLMVEIGHFTEAFIRKIEIISAGTVPQRLAALMTMLIERYGIDQDNGTAHLPINLTLEHLSEIVDARVETVARTLGNWKRQGWLSSDANGYHFAHLDQVEALLPM